MEHLLSLLIFHLCGKTVFSPFKSFIVTLPFKSVPGWIRSETGLCRQIVVGYASLWCPFSCAGEVHLTYTGSLGKYWTGIKLHTLIHLGPRIPIGKSFNSENSLNLDICCHILKAVTMGVVRWDIRFPERKIPASEDTGMVAVETSYLP